MSLNTIVVRADGQVDRWIESFPAVDELGGLQVYSEETWDPEQYYEPLGWIRVECSTEHPFRIVDGWHCALCGGGREDHERLICHQTRRKHPCPTPPTE